MEQSVIVARLRDEWSRQPRRAGQRLGMVEGGWVCKLCTYVYICTIAVLVLIGFSVVMYTLGQLLMGLGSATKQYFGFASSADYSDGYYS